MVSSPGYYETSVEVYLESNLYDLGTEELMWSAQSMSEDPKSISNMSKQFADSMVQDLMQSQIITAR